MSQSPGAHELALTTINTSKGFNERADRGHTMLKDRSAAAARVLAKGWLTDAIVGAVDYERQFGSPGASCFEVQDILGAAIELADYYEQRAREISAA